MQPAAKRPRRDLLYLWVAVVIAVGVVIADDIWGWTDWEPRPDSLLQQILAGVLVLVLGAAAIMGIVLGVKVLRRQQIGNCPNCGHQRRGAGIKGPCGGCGHGA